MPKRAKAASVGESEIEKIFLDVMGGTPTVKKNINATVYKLNEVIDEVNQLRLAMAALFRMLVQMGIIIESEEN